MIANWKAAIVVLEQAADQGLTAEGVDATLEHVANLLGNSTKAQAACAEAQRLARLGRWHEAAAHLRKAQPSPVKWVLLLLAGLLAFTGLMVALPVGAMLFKFWEYGLIGPGGPAGAGSAGSAGSAPAGLPGGGINTHSPHRPTRSCKQLRGTTPTQRTR